MKLASKLTGNTRKNTWAWNWGVTKQGLTATSLVREKISLTLNKDVLSCCERYLRNFSL